MFLTGAVTSMKENRLNARVLKSQHLEVSFKAAKEWGVPDLQGRWTQRSLSVDV